MDWQKRFQQASQKRNVLFFQIDKTLSSIMHILKKESIYRTCNSTKRF